LAAKLILTFGFIFIVLFGGILADRLYARFARRNPNLGPFRDKEKCGCCAAKDSCSSQADCND
jgi:Na+/glutamate symporter